MSKLIGINFLKCKGNQLIFEEYIPSYNKIIYIRKERRISVEALTIDQASNILQVEVSTLRYWEKEFNDFLKMSMAI